MPGPGDSDCLRTDGVVADGRSLWILSSCVAVCAWLELRARFVPGDPVLFSSLLTMTFAVLPRHANGPQLQPLPDPPMDATAPTPATSAAGPARGPYTWPAYVTKRAATTAPRSWNPDLGARHASSRSPPSFHAIAAYPHVQPFERLFYATHACHDECAGWWSVPPELERELVHAEARDDQVGVWAGGGPGAVEEAGSCCRRVARHPQLSCSPDSAGMFARDAAMCVLMMDGN